MSKQIEISDQTYQAIAAVASDVSAFVEQAAQHQLKQQPVTASLRNPNLVGSFREFRGTMKGGSLQEIVDARHEGLR